MPGKKSKNNKKTHKKIKTKKNITTKNISKKDISPKYIIGNEENVSDNAFPKKKRIIKKKDSDIIKHKINDEDFSCCQDFFENDSDNDLNEIDLLDGDTAFDEDGIQNDEMSLSCGSSFDQSSCIENGDSDYQGYSQHESSSYNSFAYFEEKDWSSDPSKARFKVGDVVVFKNDMDGDTFVICYPSKKENFYFIKRTKTLNEFEVCGNDIDLAPKHNNKWQSYWSDFPVIPAPKPWLKNKGAQI